jgi:hypothetical protein
MTRLRWLPIAALVVLAGRSLAYALAPRATPLSVELQQQVGGPGLVRTTLVSLVVALALGSALVGVAALAVRERHLLSDRPGAAPRLRLLPLLGAALGLWIATSLAFAALESYVHWRAGLGIHGLDCLIGPVHRDALPLLAGLSLLAAAAEAAVRHVLSWLRRTLAALRRRAPARIRERAPLVRPRSATPLHVLLPGLAGPRGPPVALRPC